MPCVRPTKGTWPASWAATDGPPLCENVGTVKEACGVFGIYAPGRRVANLTFDGLYALQHRGQESAGMAVADGNTITVVKDMGLVATVFDERTLSGLQGHHVPGDQLVVTAIVNRPQRALNDGQRAGDPRRTGHARRPVHPDEFVAPRDGEGPADVFLGIAEDVHAEGARPGDAGPAGRGLGRGQDHHWWIE